MPPGSISKTKFERTSTANFSSQRNGQLAIAYYVLLSSDVVATGTEWDITAYGEIIKCFVWVAMEVLAPRPPPTVASHVFIVNAKLFCVLLPYSFYIEFVYLYMHV